MKAEMDAKKDVVSSVKALFSFQPLQEREAARRQKSAGQQGGSKEGKRQRSTGDEALKQWLSLPSGSLLALGTPSQGLKRPSPPLQV